MRKIFLIVMLMLSHSLFVSSSKCQWNLKSNTEDGKFSIAINSSKFFGVSSGKISSEAVLMLSPSDTSVWKLVTNSDNGLYSLAENKVSYMGIDSGKIRTRAVYILNPVTLTSLGLDTTRLSYLGKANNFTGRKQTFDTVNASVKYLLNGTDINTAGTLSNVAYLNQNAGVTGRYSFNDLVNFQDSVQLGSAYLFYLNGKINSTKSISTDTLSGNIVSAGAYNLGANRIIFTSSNNLNINAPITRDLLLGTGTAGSVFMMQSSLGNIVYSPLAVTGSATTPAIDISQTWNTTGSPTGFKFNVLHTQSGSSSLLMDWQIDGSSLLNLSKSGNLFLAGAFKPGQIITQTASGGASVLSITQRILQFSFYNTSETSGTVNSIGATPQIVPSSGTAVFNMFNLNPTVNQTGGANGVTRGLYVNPILTSAADWRAIEVSNGKSIFQDVVVNSDTKGIVLKDSTGHYWRVTVNTSGVVSTTDLGTSLTGF